MEGFGGLFGDPDELQKRMAEFADQMQGQQRLAWADNAIGLAVQMTVAAVNRVNIQGTTAGAGGADPGGHGDRVPGGGHAGARSAPGPAVGAARARAARTGAVGSARGAALVLTADLARPHRGRPAPRRAGAGPRPRRRRPGLPHRGPRRAGAADARPPRPRPPALADRWPRLIPRTTWRVTPAQVVEHEARRRPRTGLIALAAAIVTVAANVIQTSIFSDLPKVTPIDALRETAGESLGAGRTGLASEQALYLHDHASGAGARDRPAGARLLRARLHPARAAADDARPRRQGRAADAASWSTSASVLAGVGALARIIGLVRNAADFASSHDQSTAAAHDVVRNGSLLVGGTLVGQLGLFALAAAIVLVALAAMRVGLLPRFVGDPRRDRRRPADPRPAVGAVVRRQRVLAGDGRRADARPLAGRDAAGLGGGRGGAVAEPSRRSASSARPRAGSAAAAAAAGGAAARRPSAAPASNGNGAAAPRPRRPRRRRRRARSASAAAEPVARHRPDRARRLRLTPLRESF